MVVSELIEMLKKMPQDAIVARDGKYTWRREPKILTENEVKNKIYLGEDEGKNYLYIDVARCDY